MAAPGGWGRAPMFNTHRATGRCDVHLLLSASVARLGSLRTRSQHAFTASTATRGATRGARVAEARSPLRALINGCSCLAGMGAKRRHCGDRESRLEKRSLFEFGSQGLRSDVAGVVGERVLRFQGARWSINQLAES